MDIYKWLCGFGGISASNIGWLRRIDGYRSIQYNRRCLRLTRDSSTGFLGISHGYSIFVWRVDCHPQWPLPVILSWQTRGQILLLIHPGSPSLCVELWCPHAAHSTTSVSNTSGNREVSQLRLWLSTEIYIYYTLYASIRVIYVHVCIVFMRRWSWHNQLLAHTRKQSLYGMKYDLIQYENES